MSDKRIVERLKCCFGLLLVVGIGCLLSACGSLLAPSSSPTPTVSLTPSPRPTATSTFTLNPSPTCTFTPTATPTKTPIPASPTSNLDFLFNLSGKPLPYWSNMPVMPQAVAGEENSGVYYYYLKASRKEVHQYYLQQMPYWGWQLFASGTKQNGDMLIFIKGHVTVTVGIIARGDLVSVMLLNS
jgi:hypothetical protein